MHKYSMRDLDHFGTLPHILDEEILDEDTYKDMMSILGLNLLPHKDYLPFIKMVRYVGHNHNTMKFFVPNRYNGWECYVQFQEWDNEVADRDYNAVEAARLLFWGGNLRLHCGCPAFRFWGMEYILTQRDAAIVPEKRYPSIRNPQLKGYCCKHLRKTLISLPFHLGDIAKNIKLQRAAIDLKGS